MVRVAAPQFDLEECNNEAERAFIEALHARAEVGNWNADAWVWDDRVVVAVSMCDQTPGYNLLLRTLRVDFDGAGGWFGTDETQQFATELDPARPGVSVLSGRPVVELAAAAAEWLEREMRRPVARHEWDGPDRQGVAPRLWVFADTGEGLCVWPDRFAVGAAGQGRRHRPAPGRLSQSGRDSGAGVDQALQPTDGA